MTHRFGIFPNLHFKTLKTVQGVHTEIQTVTYLKILYLIENDAKY